MIARLACIPLVVGGALWMAWQVSPANAVTFDIEVTACLNDTCTPLGVVTYGGGQYGCETHLETVREAVLGTLVLPFGLPTPQYEIKARCRAVQDDRA